MTSLHRAIPQRRDARDRRKRLFEKLQPLAGELDWVQ
jgi:hypothetical protein